MKFYELEPFGADRDNYHSATIAALIYNVNRGKNAEPKSTSDFMYKDKVTEQIEKTSNFLTQMEALAKRG